MPLAERAEVTVTPKDIETIRKLAQDTRDPASNYPGIRTLKNALAFPDIYGEKRVGGAVPPDGEYWYNKEKTMRYVRASERHFVGSTAFPDGLVIGTTDIESHRVESGDEWAFRSSQEDISPEERRRIECMVEGIPYFSQRSHMQRLRERSLEKKQIAAGAKDPVGVAAAAGAQAAIAAMQQMQKPQAASK